MTEVIIAILAFIVAIGVLVTVHELGHCLVARACGVKVLTFSIGFGRPLYQWHTKSGIACVIGWIPLGGYVKMLDERVEAVAKTDSHLAFNNQSISKRLLIVLAGPVANFLLAILCFWLVLMLGIDAVAPAVVGEITPNSAASQIDLRPGDTIKAINGQPIIGWYDLVETTSKLADQKATLTLKRKKVAGDLSRSVVFGKRVLADGTTVGSLGIKLVKTDWPAGAAHKIKFGVLPGLILAATHTKEMSLMTLMAIKKMVVGETNTSSLGGPIAIAKEAGESVQGGLEYYLSFIGLISISLGVVNLLPIPMLDGGHVLFLLIEFVSRRPISTTVHMFGLKIGVVVLVLVMGIALFNDFSSIVFIG